jgi:hypothetical protein
MVCRARVISSLMVLAGLAAACSDATETTPTDDQTAPTTSAAGPPAALAGTCPTQEALDATQQQLESASGGASKVDDLSAEYDASFAFLAAYLPPDLLTDLAAVRTAFRGYLQALEGIDLGGLDQTNPEGLTKEQAAALDQASQAFLTPEVEQANARIEQYFVDACPDVDFGGSTGTTTPE